MQVSAAVLFKYVWLSSRHNVLKALFIINLDAYKFFTKQFFIRY